MKNIKFLFLIFLITLLLNAKNMKADNEPYYFEGYAPPFNGFID